MRPLLLSVVLSLVACPDPPPVDPGTLDMDRDGVIADLDCDDDDPEIYPGADEVCDGVDNDCDGRIDEGAPDKVAFYRDDDQDGYGTDSSILYDCFAPDGFVANAGDCADTDPDRHPGADEICDEVDNDCDDEIDNDPIDGDWWYPDVDRDGFGGDAGAVRSCTSVPRHLPTGGDCDDAIASINPDGVEVCDVFDRDEDCDGLINDLDDSLTDAWAWYPDVDEDDYGDQAAVVFSCLDPGGYIRFGGDCRDDLADVHPDAPEVCANELDDNCDGHAAECGLNGTHGAELADSEWYGRQGGESLGTVVFGLPDMNGDGRGEVAMAATRWTAGTTINAGRVALVYGPASPGGDVVIADRLWEGTTGNALMGTSLAFAGDLNADGEAELWMALPGVATAHVVAVDHSDVSVDSVAQISSTQTTTDKLGEVMVSVPDFTDDGVPELIIGAPRWTPSGSAEVGAVFVMVGAAGHSRTVAARQAQVTGVSTGARCGSAVAAPDLDGDGEPSVVVGCPQHDSSKGQLAIFNALPTGASLITDADQREVGAAADYALGATLAWGDHDGDGYADLAVAASGQGASGVSGTVYLLAGGSGGIGALSSAERVYSGEVNGDEFGGSLAMGDLDDDGADELVVGARRVDSYTGTAYIFRWADGAGGSADALDASGIVRGSTERDGFATSVAVAPDIDNDGFNDLIVGAPNRKLATSGQGQVYIFKGGPGY